MFPKEVPGVAPGGQGGVPTWQAMCVGPTQEFHGHTRVCPSVQPGEARGWPADPPTGARSQGLVQSLTGFHFSV